jgi:transcriptional regulator with XRE-family HTH domain
MFLSVATDRASAKACWNMKTAQVAQASTGISTSSRASRIAISREGFLSPESQRLTADSDALILRASEDCEMPSSDIREASKRLPDRVHARRMDQSIHTCENLSNVKSEQALATGLAICQDGAVKERNASTFGQRLKTAMARKNWNARTLAEKAGLSESAVSRHLKSADPPKPDSIEKYRLALDVSDQWLAYNRGNMVESTSLVGEAALESVLDSYAWPDVDVAILDRITELARAEARAEGASRPPSIWIVRLTQLTREQLRS